MIRRIAAIAALLLLTLMSAASAHSHGGAMPMMGAPAANHAAPVASDIVLSAITDAGCRPDGCGGAGQSTNICSAICAIACLAVLDEPTVAMAIVGPQIHGVASLQSMLPPTTVAPPTPPPRA